MRRQVGKVFFGQSLQPADQVFSMAGHFSSVGVGFVLVLATEDHHANAQQLAERLKQQGEENQAAIDGHLLDGESVEQAAVVKEETEHVEQNARL